MDDQSTNATHQANRLWYVFLPVIMILVLAGAMVAWYYPKTMPHPISPDLYKLYYRGFDIRRVSLPFADLLDRQFYKIVSEKEVYGRWEVECWQLGFNKYELYHPNGNLMAQGEILVEKSDIYPYPDQHIVRNADYFDTDGKLVSKIRNGTGKQFFYYPNRQMMWYLELKDYKRVEHKMWSHDGVITSHEVY